MQLYTFRIETEIAFHMQYRLNKLPPMNKLPNLAQSNLLEMDKLHYAGVLSFGHKKLLVCEILDTSALVSKL